jgi:hypothetical protein
MPEIDAITPDLFAADLKAIIEQAPLAGLGEGPQSPQTTAAIEEWRESSDDAGTLVESALWLLAGELERSHVISQSYESAEGSFWHGIMHRREGDFGNATYWFRRVGSGHPVHLDLARLIEQRKSEIAGLPVNRLVDSNTLPVTLVDMCHQAVRGPSAAWQEDLCKVCWWEWQLLFAYGLGPAR